MNNFNHSCVRLSFKFVPVNSSYMNLTIVSNLETIVVQPQDKVIVEINAVLPCDILLNFSGKNINDTVVDENGKILEDKHVELVDVAIDRLPISQHFVLGWPISNNTRTSYFGFNETVRLEFHEKNAFYFAVKHSN